MGITDGVGCIICHDSAQCSPFKPTCGHTFGRSCMQRWMESSGQRNCLTCTRQLTDDEVEQINQIPLSERVVKISIKAIPIFGRTASIYLGGLYAGFASGVVLNGSLNPASVIAIAANTAVFIPVAAIGALGAAADAPIGLVTGAGAAAGACGGVVFNHAVATCGVLNVSGTVVCLGGATIGAALALLAYEARE
ncbi:E3 ubiquitin protein ligase [Thalassotalea sp. G20_0]|nr:E3 ubiquitin protein ligase [Thalassotalea sp. G20_0]